MAKLALHPEITFCGETNFRNQRRKFGIKTDDRRRHMYLIGKTGMGKSTVLEGLIIQDIYNGKGLAVVDPHGDLAEKIVKMIPKNRINDVIYFNPSDMDFPIAFNVLENVDPQYRHLVASGMVGVFKKIWADSWGPRLEYLLRNVILALLDYKDSTLLGIPRMFVDNNFRKKVIGKIDDVVVKAFWVDEFSKYNQQFLTEAISPIQNKVGQFLSSSLIRNIVGQVKSSIDIRKVMDEGKILIMNLSKGRIGEDNSALLGAMMITKIQLAAMSRVDIEETTRKDFYLYVDEFQNFATESFANILSEARKYRLNLIIAHQYIEQLGDVVKAAVFGNVGTMIVFRVGATDADELVKEFTPRYTEEDLVNIPKYNCYIKLMIDGIASEPFSAIGIAPIEGNTGNAEKVIGVTRERYSSPRETVEDRIRRWSGMASPEEEQEKDEEKRRKKRNKKKIKKIEKLLPEYEKLAEMGNEEARGIIKQLTQAARDLEADKDVDLGDIIGRDEEDEINREAAAEVELEKEKAVETPKPENRHRGSGRPQGKRHEIVCDECGKTDTIHFEPDPNRPIYCGDCLKKRKEKKQSRRFPKKDGDASKPISLNEAPDKKIRLSHGRPE